jgi:hypothetical protein
MNGRSEPRTYDVVGMIPRIGALTRSWSLIKTRAIGTHSPQRIIFDAFWFVSEVAALEKLLDFLENVGSDF